MSKTKIEWAERVWNPVRGCSRVSEGCRNCYAERLAARFSRPLVQDQTGEYAGGDPFAGFARMTREGPRWTGREGWRRSEPCSCRHDGGGFQQD